MAAVVRLVGIPVVRLPLHDGVELCCSGKALVYSLALARRVLAVSPASPPRALGPDLWPDLWSVRADFVLTRATPAAGLRN
jgi:hypothetical protein